MRTKCSFRPGILLLLGAVSCGGGCSESSEPEAEQQGAGGTTGQAGTSATQPPAMPDSAQAGSNAGDEGTGGSSTQGQGGADDAASAGSGGTLNQGGDSTGDGGAGGQMQEPEPICPDGPFNMGPLPDMPQVVEACPGYDFTFAEGPVWFHERGALFFSDFQQRNPDVNFTGNIVRYTPGGACETFIEDVGTNGLAVGPNGELLGASHLTQTIEAFDLDNQQSDTLIADYMGDPFGSPNDLTVRSSGSIYFTDPAWEVGNRDEVLPQGAYWRDPQGNLSFIEPLPRANGITLSVDESVLYVAAPGSITAYQIADDGQPSNPDQFISSGSDGMVLDCAGNLYLTTNNSVLVYDENGDLVGSVDLGTNTTNVAFGGPERKTLFITGREGLRYMELNIPGFPY